MAVTFAFLQSVGTSPCSRLLLKIMVNRGAISSASSFRILAGMESGPFALFGFTFRCSFVTPSTDIWSRSLVDRVLRLVQEYLKHLHGCIQIRTVVQECLLCP